MCVLIIILTVPGESEKNAKCLASHEAIAMSFIFKI